MRDANVLFVSDDLALRDSIYESVPKVKGCRLYLLNHEDFQPSLTYSSVDLLIYHIQSSSNASRIEALFNSSDFSPKSISTLIVSDDHLPERSLKFLKMGVVDCLSRPLDLRRLAYLIDSLTLRARNEATIQSPGVSLCNSSASAEEDFYYSSPKLKQVLDYVRKAARQDTTLLLTGETGTGKTFLARLIHQLSPRSSEPYIDVNCGTLQESLIESELFGHRKGAFTGADSDRDGRFFAAKSGTLLLDEVDSLPLSVQCKLLRAVDERLFEPVGSNDALKLKVRLIIASNRRLDKEVAEGRFRPDLYFRLNVVEVRMPPLRKCRSAIRPLAERFLTEFATRNHRPTPVLSAEVLSVLTKYRWPGNIRELRNAIEYIGTFCSEKENIVRLTDLPYNFQNPEIKSAKSFSRATSTVQLPEFLNNAAPDLSDHVLDESDSVLEELEVNTTSGKVSSDSAILKKLPDLSILASARIKGEIRKIREVLKNTGNNRTQTARELGISRVALYKKLHKYGLIEIP